MSQFAPVAPIQILEQLHEKKMLGNYHLLLTHDVLANSQRFFKLFKHQWYQFATIMVDNSVIELGHPVTPAAIAEATAIIAGAVNQWNAVAILPDELLDCNTTIELSLEALDHWPAKYADQPKMFVPQGASLHEFIQCAEKFARRAKGKVKSIGVARNAVSVCGGTRRDLIHVLQAIFPGCKFHLLGFSDNLIDDVICARMLGIEGIDSAVPLRIADQGIRISMTDCDYPGRGTWWNNAEDVSPLTIENINTVRSWING